MKIHPAIFHSRQAAFHRRDEFHESLTSKSEIRNPKLKMGTRGTRPSERGFTMIEIAVCLAIIGFALVAIIGVLPLGMNTQRDVREQTIINQDATVLLNDIRTAARGADDLTNYVYAINNTITDFDTNGAVLPGSPHSAVYTLTNATYDGAAFGFGSQYWLTNGLRIIGLLSTPEFVDTNSRAISDTLGVNYTSNHIIAYVRSISGLAAEKPPQNNDIMVGDTFSYQVYCVNAPMAVYSPPLWQALTYNQGDSVSYIVNGLATYWIATAATLPADMPNASSKWMRNFYPQELAASLRELRLTFLWPQLPNGNVGNQRQTFRVSVAGQLAAETNDNNLYFYQPQTFTNAP
jgi:prepilin-type N-terminal cleavage/methylation domain-containing protein